MNTLFISLTAVILGIWLLLFAMFFGIGLFIRRFFGLKIDDIEPCFIDFWLGWALTIVFLQIWHFFLRVDWRAFYLVLFIGISGLLLNHRVIRHSIKKISHINKFYHITLLLMALWLASCSMLAPTIYDTGLYHLPSVRWAMSSSIIPGLGNLSEGFAFNSSFFLYVAMLASTLGWEFYHLANGLLVAALFAQILLGYHKLFKRKNGPMASHIFNALLLGPVLYLIFYVNVSNPTPDFPVFILGIVLAAQLIALSEKQPLSYKEVAYRMFSVATIAAVGITIKQSFFIMGITTLSILSFIYFRNRDKFGSKKIFVLSLGSVIAVLIFWAARGVILSGYVAYPLPLGSFPVEWRVPYANAMNTVKLIKAWSRMRFTTAAGADKILATWDWFIPWVIRMSHNLGMVASFAWSAIGCVLILFYRFSKRHKIKTGQLTPLFLLPSIIYIPIWFLTAPNIRFLGSSLCILGAGTFTIAINNYGLLRSKTRLNIFLSSYLILCGIFFLTSGWKILPKIFAQSCHGFSETPRVDVRPFLTNSGLIIYVPKEGDQCWDAPLPCAPDPNPNLRLRRKENMYSGFMMEQR